MKFSVLMSVYNREKPEYLQQALESMRRQTYQPDEVVIVEDGPLTPDLYEMLKMWQEVWPVVRVETFPVSRGLGLALRDGIPLCRNEWIARMDTDDVAHPDRFERQVAFLEAHPEISLLGTAIEEFSADIDCPDSVTHLPETHEKILAYARRRNPFRHMTVMYRKSAVVASENYRDFPWFEDYDLFVRMLQHGYQAANLPDVLVSVRAGKDMFARRGGWRYFRQELRFQSFMRQSGCISILEFLENILVRGAVRILPNRWRIWFYQTFLRKG